MAMEAPYLVFDFNTSFILKKKGLYNLAKTWHDGKAEGPNIYDFGSPLGQDGQWLLHHFLRRF